jgi:8-oxo-dGTP pyrophosphatase MutT (NUDIX family)
MPGTPPPGLRERVARLAGVAPPQVCPPLRIAGQACGHLQPFAARLFASADTGVLREGEAFTLREPAASFAERSARLEEAARALLCAGLSGPWREELLAVRAARDEPALAQVDRSAVRALGITTHSVHINGLAPDGRIVVARRAADKRVDPGLWDTLAGGIVAAGESAGEALARETWEEAGLVVEGLAVREVGRVFVQRPIPEGHLLEWVDIFDVVVPDPSVLANQDGEVDAIELWKVEKVLQGIKDGIFTIEASLAILDSLSGDNA